MIHLYDPRTNIITETSYDYLEELTGLKRGTLVSYRSIGNKIRNINCYILSSDTTVQQRKAWYEKEVYEGEYWKVIKGSDEKFLISNYGRFKRVYKSKTGFLLPFLHRKRGNLLIKVRYNGIYKSHKITTLVGRHFIGEPKPGEVLRHKNGIKTDDFVGNLEYIPNSTLGKLTGGISTSKPVVQLDKDTKELIAEFRSAREAGRNCFLSYQAVLDNCNHKRSSSGGWVFMFAEEYEKSLLSDGPMIAT
ncbi:NUMOD4 domain-containing protein [Desertibacillus haloalkaliphilus]|uniref:NUMOD4 domain-containing protein n=1 Tax=Desertibacillus haloalkaliphilus TaxID=1328930 RepID=UPI001C2772A6|nr:NUMOD4 domain-containing protein [Desertibacillus haloalkaliphilus]MBU8908532.1 hypothetical protein [Desertibacillus haloalkaliphilus]